MHLESRKLIWLILPVVVVLAGVTYRVFATGGVTNSTGGNLRQPFANTKGLVAWYPFDGDVKDYSGNTNNGALSNFTFDGTTNGWVQGKFGKGLLFNGLTDLDTVATSTTTNTVSLITLSVWINPGTLSASNGRIIDKSAWSLFYSQGAAKNVTFSQNFSTGNLTFATPTNSISTNVWQHLVVIYDRSLVTNVPTIYINGVSQTITTSGSASGSIASDNSNAAIIGNRLDTTRGFAGSLDDFRFYNRLLSTTEVSQLYAGSASPNCDQYCVAWLPFDDNSGSSVSDATGKGNTGTINGTTTWTTGNFASALTLNGTSGYVSLPNLGLSAGTVDLWIYPTSVSGDQHLFTQLSGATSQAGQLDINQSSGESGSLWVWDGSAWQRLSATGSITAAKWNQVVVTNNGGSATAYINGVQQLTATAAFNFSGVTAGIGAKFLTTTGGTFNGKVDDFRVYSRILAPEEVADQYRQGS